MADKVDKTASPFAGLDKALLQSGRVPAAAEVTPAAPAAPVASRPRRAPKPAAASRPAPQEPDDVIEAIRRAVRTPGKEAGVLRLSEEEKQRLEDIVYTYKRQGLNTSKTEVIRIGLYSLLLDYDVNGEQSVLARAVTALNS